MRAPIAERFGRKLQRRPILEHEAAELAKTGVTSPVEVWASRDWLVQIFADPAGERITVNRTTMAPRGGRWLDGISWDELQQLKHNVGRGDKWALEVYPPNDCVVNVANMRHLFVVDEPPAFAWNRTTE